MGRLEGRVCVVTGAASGIGRAVASAMVAEGGRVVGFDVREAPVGDGGSLVCDVTDVGSVERAVEAVHARHGRVDVLVNVAGIHRAGTVATTTPQDWDAVVAVNLRGPYLVSRTVLLHMVDQGRGTIVHIASVAGLVGGRDSAAYIASKGGLIALTKAMAIDHAHQGIRVNCVCPGMIRTPMLARTEEGLDREALAHLRDERAARHPLGRVGGSSRCDSCGPLPRKRQFVVGDRLGPDGRRRLYRGLSSRLTTERAIGKQTLLIPGRGLAHFLPMFGHMRTAGMSQYMQGRDVPAGSPTVLRSLNRARILRLVRARPSISRVELARETGLSKPTVNKIVAELLAEGLLREVPVEGRARRVAPGPRPKWSPFAPSSDTSLASISGPTSCWCTWPISRATCSRPGGSPARGPRRAHAVLAEVRREVEAMLASVGVGATRGQGARRRDAGRRGPRDLAGLARTPDCRAGRTSTSWPTSVVASVAGTGGAGGPAFDARGALAWCGSGRGRPRLHQRGNRHRGGDPARWRAPSRVRPEPLARSATCPSARRAQPTPEGFGRFECAAGGGAYARLGGGRRAHAPWGQASRDWRGATRPRSMRRSCSQAAAEGDPAALAIVDELVGRLARGVASVATVVDPSVVVIGGGLSRAGEPLRARLERDVQRLLPVRPASCCPRWARMPSRWER